MSQSHFSEKKTLILIKPKHRGDTVLLNTCLDKSKIDAMFVKEAKLATKLKENLSKGEEKHNERSMML